MRARTIRREIDLSRRDERESCFPAFSAEEGKHAGTR